MVDWATVREEQTLLERLRFSSADRLDSRDVDVSEGAHDILAEVDADMEAAAARIVELERLLKERVEATLVDLPVGWRLVPMKSTPEMEDAAYAAYDEVEAQPVGAWCGLSHVFEAMVAKAPSPPVPVSTEQTVPQTSVGTWDAHREFNERAENAREVLKYVIEGDGQSGGINKHLARNRQHLRDMFRKARSLAPDVADTLAWLLWWEATDAERFSFLAGDFIQKRDSADIDEVGLWRFWNGKARQLVEDKSKLVSALRAVANIPFGPGLDRVHVSKEDVVYAKAVIQLVGRETRIKK